jgi:hypothetical protein
MLPGCWAQRGGTLSTQITMPDGTETDLINHLRLAHQKGTRGFTEQYLITLHDQLHQRKREPQPGHDHPATEIPTQPGPVDA